MPWKAAANTKKLLRENRAVLMLNASPSPTYAGIIAEAKNAGVPLIFASSVCPKDAYPPTNESQFCTTASAATYDSRAALAFVKDAATEPVKIAFAAMAIPLSRIEMDFAAREAIRFDLRRHVSKLEARRVARSEVAAYSATLLFQAYHRRRLHARRKPQSVRIRVLPLQ
jgi:hypothetical protein